MIDVHRVVQRQPVVATPPVVTDARPAFDHQRVDAHLVETRRDRQAGLRAADDEHGRFAILVGMTIPVGDPASWVHGNRARRPAPRGLSRAPCPPHGPAFRRAPSRESRRALSPTRQSARFSRTMPAPRPILVRNVRIASTHASPARSTSRGGHRSWSTSKLRAPTGGTASAAGQPGPGRSRSGWSMSGPRYRASRSRGERGRHPLRVAGAQCSAREPVSDDLFRITVEFDVHARSLSNRMTEHKTGTTRPETPGRKHMALYELRTYTLYVGKIAEAVKLYQDWAFPRSTRAATTSASSATSRATPARSTRSSIYGNSKTMPRAAPLDRPCSRTRISPRALREIPAAGDGPGSEAAPRRALGTRVLGKSQPTICTFRADLLQGFEPER